MPAGHRSAEAEWIADGQNPIANARHYVAEFKPMVELVLALDLEKRDVGAGIAANDLGLVLLLVLEGDLDLVRLLRDVMVRHHIAVRGDKEAGALRAHRMPFRLIALELVEEVAEILRQIRYRHILTRSFAHRAGGFHVDADDGGPDLVGQIGEARRALILCRGRGYERGLRNQRQERGAQQPSPRNRAQRPQPQA